VLANLFRFF